MLSDLNINIDISPLKNKDKDNKDKDKDKYVPPKEFRTIFKGTYPQPLQRMWRIIYDDGRLPMEERETFFEEYTLKGKTDFNCSDWEAPDKSQHADCYHPNNIKRGWKRSISYIMDIDAPIGPKHTRTSADEEILEFDPTKIIIESVSSTPDVPYGSSFNTIIIQCLFEDEVTHETTFEVYGFMRWTKSCVIKKSIEKFAFNGMIDHQKEMDKELNRYIEENPNPKYSEDLIYFSSPPLSSSSYNNNNNESSYYSFDYETLYDQPNESHDKLLQDLSHNKDMTTLNNNLVYDNILEIKEKELENNQYGRNTYCSSLANTFNSSYVNYSERSLFEEKIMKLKSKHYYDHSPYSSYSSSTKSLKWIIATIILIITLYFIYTLKLNDEMQTQ